MKSHFAGRDFGDGDDSGKRLWTNKKTKRGLKAWIPASAGMTEKREFRYGERLRKKLLREERLRGKDKYIL
jgi:hypothetical protein